MINLRLAAALAVLVVFGGGAVAQGVSVQALLDHCEAPKGSDRALFCLGTVYGAQSILSANCIGAGRGYKTAPDFKMAELPSLGAGQQAFVNWARENPGKWGEPAGLGLAMAFSRAFPCNG